MRYLMSDALRIPSLANHPTRRSFAPSLSALTLTIGMLLSSPGSAADEAVFIVPDGASSFEITFSDLIASVPGASGPVAANTPTGRGHLFNLGSRYQYQPSADFFSRGSDSFHFEVTVDGVSVWSPAFLVAGMRGDGAFFLPLDDPETEMKSVKVHGSRTRVNSTYPIHGPYDLGLDVSVGEPPSYVEPLVQPGEPAEDAANGGLLGGTPAGSHDLVDAELVIASAYDPMSQDLARVLLVGGSKGLEIVGEVRSNAAGALVRSQPMAMLKAVPWALHWWSATAPGSFDGGALLRHGGTTRLITGLDNPDLELAGWKFGAVYNSGFNGWLQLDDLTAGTAITIPRGQPVFADNFEGAAPVWSGESCGDGPMAQSSVGELAVPLDAAIVDCYRSRAFATSQRQHRVRFTVNLENAVLPPGNDVALFQGRRAGDAFAQLEVSARRTSGGTLQLSVAATMDDGSVANLLPFNVAEEGNHRVEVHTWAAVPRVSKGGLRFIVDDVLIDQDLGLSQSNMAVDEVLVGVMRATEGSYGYVTFDVVEVWR